MACFLDCGRLFSGLPVMAHKGAAPAAGEIRTGQSGVTTVHLKTCQTESLALLIWSLQKLEKGNLLIPPYTSHPPTVNLISACRTISPTCPEIGNTVQPAERTGLIWLLSGPADTSNFKVLPRRVGNNYCSLIDVSKLLRPLSPLE